MKIGIPTLILALLIPLATFAFDVPSEDAVQGVLSNPATIIKLLEDASEDEASAVIVRVINAVDDTSLKDEEKTQFVALLVARVMREFSQNANFAGELLAQVPAKWKSIIAAAAVAATPDAAVKEALATEKDAVQDPEKTLGTPLYELIVGRKAAQPILGVAGASSLTPLLPPPPKTITAETVVPLSTPPEPSPVPTNNPPQPPPVAPPYPGQ